MNRGGVLAYLVYFAVRVTITAAQMVPLETAHGLAGLLAWVCCDVLRLRGQVVEENLRNAFPDLPPSRRHRLARRMWRHLFLLVFEVALAKRKVRHTNWRRYVKLDNVVDSMRRLMSDRPLVFVTGHFGNFEMGGYLLGLMGYPTYSVARTLDNPYLDRFLARFRGATGQYLIPKAGGYDQILEVLRGGGALAFLADQSAGNKGCWVDFFGRPASAHKAIALLTLEHDVPLTLVYCRRTAGPMQFELVGGGTADPRDMDDQLRGVRELTQWYTSGLEEAIRRNPEQYWWLHRRWKDHRPPHRKAASRRAA